MSDTSQGPGWWQASDGKWFPPQVTAMPASEMPYTPGLPPPKRSNRGCIIAIVLTVLVLLLIVGGVVWAVIWAANKASDAASQAFDDAVPSGDVLDDTLGSLLSGGAEDVEITGCSLTKADPTTGLPASPLATMVVTNSTSNINNYLVTVQFPKKDGTGGIGNGFASTQKLAPGAKVNLEAKGVGTEDASATPFDCKLGPVVRVASR